MDTDAMSAGAETFPANVSGASASLTEDVKKAATSTARAVQQQASELMGQVGDELSKTAEEHKIHGVEAMRGLSRAITAAASEFEGQSPRAARSAQDAARRIVGLSENIRGRSVNDLMQAASDVARSQPVWFFGATVAAGFAFARDKT